MTKETVIVISHLPWDFPCDYIKHTTLELAKRARIIVYNPLYFPTLKNLIFDQRKRKEWLALFKEKKVIYFPSLAIIPFQRLEWVNRLNVLANLLFFRFFYFIKFGFKKPIFWAFSYELAKIIKYFKRGKFLVYDRVDQVASLDPKADKAMKQEDRSLLRVADYVFTNSPYALKYIKRYNKASFLVPCGCDVGLFLKKKATQPREIKRIKKPIIGLIGSIDHRLDFKILYSLAKKRKEWSFVFIGSQFADDPAQFKVMNFYQRLEKLESLPNVYILGQKPKEKMPNFIVSFDVCLIPYDVSLEFVKGSNPMKLYEYLAMRKPVVSTPIKAVSYYSPTVKIARDADGFEQAVEKLLKKGYNKREEEEGKKIALENSWEEKVKRMWQQLQ